MLSSKNVKVHGMKDDTWTIKDKINQYRGILKLHARDKKVKVLEAAKRKKKISKDLKTLKNDVKEYRGVINDVMHGDKRRMHTVLQDHKDFQLAFENLTPRTILDAVFQDSSLKRKQLDKLYYQKKKKMKEFFDLQLECAILSDKYEGEQECPPNYAQQRLITGYQQSTAKQNAAKSIRTTYNTMLKILEKDAIYFDAVLNALKEDQMCQSKVMLKATLMGQLAAENLDDTRQRYRFMASEVWINMKERERTLNIVRGQVEDLWAYAQSLVRVESETNFGTTVVKDTTPEDILDGQIKQLEDTFNSVKDSLAVRSYEELYNRLEDQMKQKKRLLAQFNSNFKERDALLNEKNHALLVLATLEHGTVSTTGQYKTEKKAMLEEIEVQKQREKEYRNLRKSRGELVMNIRAVLQNMLAMLVCVKETTRAVKKGSKEAAEKKSVPAKLTELPGDKEENDGKSVTEEAELIIKSNTDALALLAQVSNKVNSLFAMSNIDLDPDSEEKARDLYQTYVSDYRSRVKFGEGEPEPTGLFVEHEVIDASVMTRAEVKWRSRQIVEANQKIE